MDMDLMNESSILNNSNSNLIDQTNDDEDSAGIFYKHVIYYVGGVCISIFGTLGIFINIYAFYVLCTVKTMRNFHILMACLSAFDLLHLLLEILCFSLPKLSRTFALKSLEFIPYLLPITQICVTGSSYTTLVITIERYLSIAHPFFTQRHAIKPKHFLLPVLIYTVVYNIPRFFELKIGETCHTFSETNQTECIRHIQGTSMRNNPAYISIYMNSMNLVINMLIPFIAMIIMNYMISRAMNRRLCRESTSSRSGSANHKPGRYFRSKFSVRSSYNGGSMDSQSLRRSSENFLRKREARLARASIAITIMFVLCHLPRCIPNIMELFNEATESPKWLEVMVNVNQLLITFNSAFNFLFYLSFCMTKSSVCKALSNGTTTTGTDLDDNMDINGGNHHHLRGQRQTSAFLKKNGHTSQIHIDKKLGTLRQQHSPSSSILKSPRSPTTISWNIPEDSEIDTSLNMLSENDTSLSTVSKYLSMDMSVNGNSLVPIGGGGSSVTTPSSTILSLPMDNPDSTTTDMFPLTLNLSSISNKRKRSVTKSYSMEMRLKNLTEEDGEEDNEISNLISKSTQPQLKSNNWHSKKLKNEEKHEEEEAELNPKETIDLIKTDLEN